MSDFWSWVVASGAIGFTVGLWLGGFMRDLCWREKGTSYTRTRMYSGGQFFYVTPEHEHNEMHSYWVAGKNAEMKARPHVRGGGYA